ALLSALTAHEFGYLTKRRLLARIEATLTTMQGMERHRGHFYNWYDTQTLQPLRPRYVSTVDSGNLAGQLLTLRAGLLALIDAPLLAPTWLEGVHDTLGVLRESLESRLDAAERRSIAAALAAIDEAGARCRRRRSRNGARRSRRCTLARSSCTTRSPPERRRSRRSSPIQSPPAKARKGSRPPTSAARPTTLAIGPTHCCATSATRSRRSTS